ncbi:DoxX family membrane protein [Mucilaginibacter sp. HD30]
MKLDEIYLKIRTKVWLSRVVFLLRYLIGFAFIPSGMKKLLGLRFTQIPDSDPIGHFFEAMYQMGLYWNFLGAGQLLAALLLMTQRFATLGALIFSFIAINIFVITISLPFTGTWVITSGLVLAGICLLLWDYNKLKFAFLSDNFQYETENHRPLPTHNTAWAIAGFLLFAFSVVISIWFRPI